MTMLRTKTKTHELKYVQSGRKNYIGIYQGKKFLKYLKIKIHVKAKNMAKMPK